MKDIFSQKVFFWMLSISLFVVIASTYYIFLVKKDYFFQIEAGCDPSQEICYIQSCEDSEEEGCETSFYKTFRLQAAQFQTCNSTGSCASDCIENKIVCENIVCDPTDSEVTCSDVDDSMVNDAEVIEDEEAPSDE